MALIVGLGLIWVWNSLYIIKEWERGVVLRLGRLLPEAKTAGINFVVWPIETLYRINLRIDNSGPVTSPGSRQPLGNSKRRSLSRIRCRA